MATLKVVRNEIDGWDVVNVEDGVALTNHPTREQAEEAAAMRSREDSISEEGEGEVEVDTEHVHAVDSTRVGIRPVILALAGLLVVITALLIILSLTGSLTDFGS